MPLHSTYRFIDGRMVKSEPPEWFAKADERGEDWGKMIDNAGWTRMETFGEGGDNLEIVEGPDGELLVAYWDPNKLLANVFIDNVADYLLFRATYIAPLASLIMESERHFEWEKTKRSKRAG